MRASFKIVLGVLVLSAAIASAEPPKQTQDELQPLELKPVPTSGPAGLPAAVSAELAEQARRAIGRGLLRLAARQEKDGGWTARYGPAVTAIVARAFLHDPAYGGKHAIVKRAVNSILRDEQPDGGIYERGQNLANYQTSVVLMLLAELDDPAIQSRVEKARAFLIKLQYDEAESVDPKDTWYGGAGYNSSKRPDLSNTQMMLEALHASGLPPTDPTYQKAMTFVSRCQLNGATNDQAFAKGTTDGGFIYTPHKGGESKANGFFDGPSNLRSYGTMTYSGFKSMLYAGLKRDDPRIVAAVKWIRSHYTVDSNANMPLKKSGEGLYYYYHVFSRALHAWGEPIIVDEAGASHNWRADLIRKLCALQKADGSWRNDEDRWLEGDENYVTALAIQSLQTALTP